MGALNGLSRRAELTERIRTLLAERPLSLYGVLQQLPTEDYRTLLQSWGDLRANVNLVSDARGRYSLPGGLGATARGPI